MTVSYQYKVASSTSGGFTRLLFMWRGSLYKLIYRELLLFLLAFDILSVLYRTLFTTEQKKIFEKMVIYCDTFINLIPLTFILGFYVAYVATRWWQQYEAIPWPDKVMHTISLYIPGNDEHVRIVRRTLMRYLNLTLVLILRSISSAVKKRFPTVDHLTEVGFMTPIEKQMFLSIPSSEYNTYWIPCTWFIHVLRDMKENNPNFDSQGLKLIMEEFNEFRSKCGLLWSYDWISIPLVYTQVVTLATYSFFMAAVVGRQYVENSDKAMQMEVDIYLPVFTILQFFFFMGLLKVAEQLINPFGDDDEDFELNWLIDRHTKVSYLGVDTLMLQRPPLVKDKYFDDSDLVLPYTCAAAMHKKRTYRGSVHFMQVPENQQGMYLPEIIEEQETDNSNPTTPQKSRNPSCYTINAEELNAATKENNSSASWRQTVDCVESGKRNNKKILHDSEEEMIVNNFKFRRSSTSPAASPENTLKRSHCSFTNNVATANDSDASNSATLTNIRKHNSWLYSSGKGNTIRTNENDNVKRRKSVAVLSNDRGTLNRNSFKWSLRKDSISDPQWKGIRWKPFPKENILGEKSDFSRFSPKASYDNKSENTTNVSNERVYVNEAFIHSSNEESEKSNIKTNTSEKRNRENSDSENFRRDSNVLTRGKNIKLNLTTQDSLV